MSFIGKTSIINFPLAHSRVTTMNEGRASAVWVPVSLKATKMILWVGTGSTAVNIQMGIYNSAGSRIARTASFTPSSGFVQRDLETPITLSAGSVYYFAFDWTAGEFEGLYGPYADDDRQSLGAEIALGALPASITPVSTATYTAWWLGALA